MNPTTANTVKRADLFGNVRDTFQTEAELNGWRLAQAELFDRDAYKPSKPADPRQRGLFDAP